MKRSAIFVLWLVILAPVCLFGVPPSDEGGQGRLKAELQTASSQTVMVPMRDGVKLATYVYLPTGEGPWPTILVRTSYGKDSVEELAPQANERGYALVVQDFRGRFNSEGQDYPVFTHGGWGERKDGYDTVEWIAAQPWSNGKVGGFGMSAPGIALNMMAPSRPPHLVCCYVGVAFSSMYHQAAYQGGAFRRALVEGWLGNEGFDLRNLKLVREQPDYDDFWKALNAESVASRVNVPTMFVGGWYDIFTAGTLNSFQTIHQQGDSGARGKCRLVMDAYGHGRNDDLVFPNLTPPATASAWNWFDVWMKRDGQGLDAIPVVQYFVMGDPNDPNTPGNRWRAAVDWPVPADARKIYFHADRKLRLGPCRDLFESLSVEYDPQNPVPTIGGANLTIAKGPKDQRSVEGRPDVLVFDSPILDRYVEVTGPVTAKLWVSSTATDTDFTAKLCDVYPNGRSMIVLDGILRMRHRDSMEKSELMEPGKIYEIDIDLWSTSLVFSPGHRVRVALSSSNAPRFEPNPNTGEPSGVDSRTQRATNTIYMDAKHPSHIVLPIVSP
ncbi:MAG: CocE/NonD family hydrolase [Sedimentisphaerales bacterium]|nr:CocE/NonD family hydrolase [Sedimentisphaerales bacterium]